MVMSLGPARQLAEPIPFVERSRLNALYDTELLDSPADPAFDAIVRRAAEHFECPIATIALVDRDRQWFKSKIGLEVEQTRRAGSMCSYTILGNTNEVFVIPDTRLDERFTGSTLVCKAPFVRFYAGAPIASADHYMIGALCIFGTSPRPSCTVQDMAELKSLASEVGALIRATAEENVRKQEAGAINSVHAYVGRRLRSLRMQRGISEDRLAFELGISVRNLKCIECGRDRLTAHRLKTASALLSVPMSAFFEGCSIEV